MTNGPYRIVADLRCLDEEMVNKHTEGEGRLVDERLGQYMAERADELLID